jgi:hypothetical protein
MTPEQKRERQREYQRKFRDNNREHIREYRRNWAAKNPRKILDKSLRHLYGMTLEAYEILLAEQGGVCASCSGPPTTHGRLVVDHDHRTGAIRGLVCHHCNAAIGYAGDSPKRLEAAAAYLRKRGYSQ